MLRRSRRVITCLGHLKGERKGFGCDLKPTEQHEAGRLEMGLAASQARFLALTARKSDLELTGQQINQSRVQLANLTNDLFTVLSNVEPNSPQGQVLQFRVSALQTIDKSLEEQLRRVDTQREAVQTEIDAVQKVIDKNIEMSFKTFG